MADVMNTAKNKLQEASNTAAQVANTAADSIKSAAGYVIEQAKDAASNASKAGAYLDGKAEDATAAISGGLKSAAQAIRDRGPHEGQLGQASAAVAQTFSDSANYLDEQGLQGIGNDITNLIKRNPIPALLIGIGLGFLVARASSSRN